MHVHDKSFISAKSVPPVSTGRGLSEVQEYAETLGADLPEDKKKKLLDEAKRLIDESAGQPFSKEFIESLKTQLRKMAAVMMMAGSLSETKSLEKSLFETDFLSAESVSRLQSSARQMLGFPDLPPAKASLLQEFISKLAALEAKGSKKGQLGSSSSEDVLGSSKLGKLPIGNAWLDVKDWVDFVTLTIKVLDVYASMSRQDSLLAQKLNAVRIKMVKETSDLIKDSHEIQAQKLLQDAAKAYNEMISALGETVVSSLVMMWESGSMAAEERAARERMVDKAELDNVKSEVETEHDKLTKEIKSLENEVKPLKKEFETAEKSFNDQKQILASLQGSQKVDAINKAEAEVVRCEKAVQDAATADDKKNAQLDLDSAKRNRNTLYADAANTMGQTAGAEFTKAKDDYEAKRVDLSTKQTQLEGKQVALKANDKRVDHFLDSKKAFLTTKERSEIQKIVSQRMESFKQSFTSVFKFGTQWAIAGIDIKSAELERRIGQLESVKESLEKFFQMMGQTVSVLQEDEAAVRKTFSDLVETLKLHMQVRSKVWGD
jgi:hypothetical protein